MYKVHGLAGSYRIVFEDLCQLLSIGEPVSISRLADALRRELCQHGYVAEREDDHYERNTYINKAVGRTRSLWIDCNVLFKKASIDPSGERDAEDLV